MFSFKRKASPPDLALSQEAVFSPAWRTKAALDYPEAFKQSLEILGICQSRTLQFLGLPRVNNDAFAFFLLSVLLIPILSQGLHYFTKRDFFQHEGNNILCSFYAISYLVIFLTEFLAPYLTSEPQDSSAEDFSTQLKRLWKEILTSSPTQKEALALISSFQSQMLLSFIRSNRALKIATSKRQRSRHLILTIMTIAMLSLTLIIIFL